MKYKNNTLYVKMLLLTIFIVSTLLEAAPDGNYVFQLESATQAEINNDMSGTPKNGMMVYNTSDNKIYYYNGTEWIVGINTNNVLPKTANYTLATVDNGAILTFDSAVSVTLTIPSGLPIGYNVSVYQIGTGKVNIVGSGTTVKNRLSRFKTAGKDAGVGIVCTATNVFHITGDLKK